ncbi:hypothetical protein EJ02DRAFT_435742 [Clathrospora elynae]|uniref:Uncharacterized protein n=1 Tax=Clathrospora elynae TaxID=706981 RepID=A0A6A5SKQ7_9PLEO|nr:hypothetical protein EJ02DRAFT_435742 [Clathrospora elynae]
MANEEQRRAFASYMGAAGGSSGQGQSQGQSIPQYPGSVANPGNPNPYLFNVYQFPGLGVPPTAPTPPPAAPSSVVSLPGYPGGFPQPGYGQAGYGQSGVPQRPPPLGQAQAPQGQQQMPPQAGPPGYVQVPRNYSAQPPPPPGYNVGWQYNDPKAGLERRRSGAPTGAMVPASRSVQQEIVESRSKQSSEHYHYQQYGQPQPTPTPPSQVEEVTVPVMLCHTCSHCGQMRSAGFHRNNPVLPGIPLVLMPCRRCMKKIKSSRHASSKYTRIRRCTADEPCDWPRESVHIDLDHSERRGRRRSREEFYVTRYSPSRPRVIQRSSSQAKLGLRGFQQPLKTGTTVRMSSLSPSRSSRYTGEVWPPPDVVRMRQTRSDEVYSAPPEPLPTRTSTSDEVWPPPDVVRTHSYRKAERSPPRRESSRIIELSPSPPARTRSTRVVYRSESQERSRSISPVRVRYREKQRSSEAEARLMSHPRPYRPVLPDHRTLLRASDETSSNTDSMSRRRGESPNRSILKPGGTDRETSYRRRASMRESEQSMHVEVGGPRVHFGGDRRERRPAPEPRGRPRYVDDRVSNGENYEHFREYSRNRYVDEAPPVPPTEDFERIRIRHASPSPRRSYEEEIRIDRQRRISPSPVPARRYEEVRVRHTSPLRTARPPLSPPPLERPPYSAYRHVSRTRTAERTRSITPLPPSSRQKSQLAELEDHTDSDSAHSGEITEVRSWKGIDENGKPATFVEERRTVRMLEQGSERGGGGSIRGGENRHLGERLTSRSWRDV